MRRVAVVMPVVEWCPAASSSSRMLLLRYHPHPDAAAETPIRTNALPVCLDDHCYPSSREVSICNQLLLAWVVCGTIGRPLGRPWVLLVLVLLAATTSTAPHDGWRRRTPVDTGERWRCRSVCVCACVRVYISGAVSAADRSMVVLVPTQCRRTYVPKDLRAWLLLPESLELLVSLSIGLVSTDCTLRRSR